MPESPSNNHNKQRIALSVDSLTCGGAEKITVILANALVQRGYEVDLLLRWIDGPFLSELAPEIRLLSPGEREKSAFRTVKFLVDYIRTNKPLVILPQMEKPSLLALLAGAITGYKNIVPCVHTDLTTYARLEHRTRRTLLKYLVAVFYRLAIRVVAVSSGTAHSISSLIGRQSPPVDVVFNGFDVEAMRQKAHEDPGIPWLQEKTAPVVISCGRMVEQKGYDTLLRAFAILRQTIMARLIILGDGPLRTSLEELAQNLKITQDVVMPGYHPNPVACFKHSDVFVLTSKVEGLSNVLIEALIANVPIVSTDCPTGPREVLKNGRFGGLVPVGDAGALAEALCTVLRATQTETPVDPEYNVHIRNFSVETMVDGYIRAIHAASGKGIV